MIQYYIDLGSSTIKVYKDDSTLTLLEEHSIYFKNDFDAEKGISEANMDELLKYFTDLKERYGLMYENTNIYVTGIFRNLVKEKKIEMLKIFNDKLDLHFNIISHGIENYYLSKAMQNDYNGKKVLITFDDGRRNFLENVYFQ